MSHLAAVCARPKRQAYVLGAYAPSTIIIGTALSLRFNLRKINFWSVSGFPGQPGALRVIVFSHRSQPITRRP
jgi:hypothetical protein